MEQAIKGVIKSVVEVHNAGEQGGFRRWRDPLVSFASASDPLIPELKKWVDIKHLMPADLLPEAATVICWYLPFNPEIPRSNRGAHPASPEWAETYIKTNKLIAGINQKLEDFLAEEGFKCAKTPATHNFDPKELISCWSHRHLAYIAGLGTFGLNNMLITEKGTAGRFGSCVTNLELEPGRRPEIEYCLYKANGSCGACVKNCVNGALSYEGYDRFKCYEVCLENNEFHKMESDTDVCGKCVAGMPCADKNPVK